MKDLFKSYEIFNIDPKKSRSKDFYKNMLEYRVHVMRKFARAIKKQDEFVCLLCGSKRKTSFLALGKYQLFECSRCKLVSPNVDFAQAGGNEMYDDQANIKDTMREIVETYEYRKKTYATERLAYILEKTGLRKSQMKLLDVGCGPGYFVSYLKDKKIAYKGLELSDFLVNLCRAKKLNVSGTDLKDEKSNTYTVATLFDVLEHLNEPVPFFKTLNDKLKRGGFIIAYTPHIHSIAYQLQGARQNTLYPFQHIAFYDPISLRYLAKRSGFEVVSVEYYGLDIMDYFCMKQYDDRYDYLRKLREFIPLMQAVVDKQGLSNHMRVVLRKVKQASKS